jgi:hypothetical protein
MADGLAAIMDARAPDLDKSERGMKGVRRRIGRVDIDLAGDARMPAAASRIEQVAREQASKSSPARRWRNGYSVDVGKARIACAEPQEVGTVVARVLIEREQECVEAPMRQARKACATSCSNRSGSSQDSSCACALLSARIAAPSGAAAATSSGVMERNSE